jgi:hypothetical protein
VPINVPTGQVTNYNSGDVDLSMPYSGVPVAKMYLVNLHTGIERAVQFNPTEFTRNLEVEYARQTVPGLSHKVMQYVSTNNTTFEMELFFDADNRQQILENLATRRFIESMCYPRGVDSIINGGPPRVLFVWPTFISLTTLITAMSETYTKFASDGTPLGFTIAITLEEVRNVRLLSEDVLSQGLQRSGLAPTNVNDIQIEED